MSDGFDIAAYLRATGEPEMADEVANMAHRLEAFADGLDRDCMNAQRSAFDSMKRQRDELLSALNEIHSWLVCAAIASADDMAQSFPDMERIAAEALAKAEAA